MSCEGLYGVYVWLLVIRDPSDPIAPIKCFVFVSLQLCVAELDIAEFKDLLCIFFKSNYDLRI